MTCDLVRPHSASFWSDALTFTKGGKSTLLSQLFNYNERQNVFQRLGFLRTQVLEVPLCDGWTFDPNRIRADNTWGMIAKKFDGPKLE